MKHTYRITLGVSRQNMIRRIINDVPYSRMPKSYKGDCFQYWTQKIQILAIRNKSYSYQDMVTDRKNSIYEQINKSIIYLYAKNKKNVFVGRIKVEEKINGAFQLVQDTKLSKEVQPVQRNFVLLGAIPDKILDLLFKNRVNTPVLITSLTHYFSGVSTTQKFSSFIRLWRAFEQLALWHSQHKIGSPNEALALIKMRQYITTAGTLIETKRLGQKIKLKEISLCHWDLLVENNYSNKQKAINLFVNNFIYQNRDKRLISMIKKVKVLKDKRLKELNLDVQVNNYISSLQYLGEQHNDQVVAMLVCKYAYFLRNKYIHGEEVEYTFTFSNHTEDDDVLDMLNKLLCRLVFELFLDFDNL